MPQSQPGEAGAVDFGSFPFVALDDLRLEDGRFFLLGQQWILAYDPRTGREYLVSMRGEIFPQEGADEIFDVEVEFGGEDYLHRREGDKEYYVARDGRRYPVDREGNIIRV